MNEWISKKRISIVKIKTKIKTTRLFHKTKNEIKKENKKKIRCNSETGKILNKREKCLKEKK